MRKILHKIHTFSVLIILTIIFLIIGVIFRFCLSEESIQDLSTNIIQISQMKRSFLDTFISPFLFSFSIFLLGISIIGIPIILLLYCSYVFLFAFESISFLLYYHFSFSILFCLIPRMIRVFCFFFISFYAISYSIYLFKCIFHHTNIPISSVTKKYLKYFLIPIFFILLSSCFEFFLLPVISTIKI